MIIIKCLLINFKYHWFYTIRTFTEEFLFADVVDADGREGNNAMRMKDGNRWLCQQKRPLLKMVQKDSREK